MQDKQQPTSDGTTSTTDGAVSNTMAAVPPDAKRKNLRRSVSAFLFKTSAEEKNSAAPTVVQQANAKTTNAAIALNAQSTETTDANAKDSDKKKDRSLLHTANIAHHTTKYLEKRRRASLAANNSIVLSLAAPNNSTLLSPAAPNNSTLLSPAAPNNSTLMSSIAAETVRPAKETADNAHLVEEPRFAQATENAPTTEEVATKNALAPTPNNNVTSFFALNVLNDIFNSETLRKRSTLIAAAALFIIGVGVLIALTYGAVACPTIALWLAPLAPGALLAIQIITGTVAGLAAAAVIGSCTSSFFHDRDNKKNIPAANSESLDQLEEQSPSVSLLGSSTAGN